VLQKLQEIENIPVLFVLVKHPNARVDVIARSRLASVDMNRILARFGGGGHPGAASAKVMDTDALQIKERLIKILKATIKVKLYARDIMSKETNALGQNITVDEARKILLKDGLGGSPVVDKGKVIGIITMNHLNKAIKRGFGHSRIKGYMARDIIKVRPGTPLHAIQDIIMNEDAGVLPVLSGRVLVGVVNRTDVLRNVHTALFSGPRGAEKKAVSSLSGKMTKLLPKDIMRLLRHIGRKANLLGYSAFIVGGVVRDLIMGVKNFDLDIVVEGDATKLGRALAEVARVVHDAHPGLLGQQS